LSCDFRELILYLGLYIKIDLFSSIPALLGLKVLADVFRVFLPVPLQVAGVLAQPCFDALIIVLAALGIPPSPAGVGVSLAGFLTGGGPAALLPFADSGVRAEGLIAVRASSPFHPGPLSRLE
jgi:hypothetical protein